MKKLSKGEKMVMCKRTGKMLAAILTAGAMLIPGIGAFAENNPLHYVNADFNDYVGTKDGTKEIPSTNSDSNSKFTKAFELTGYNPGENYYIGEVPEGRSDKALKVVSEVVHEGSTSYQSLNIELNTSSGKTNTVAKAVVFEGDIMFEDTRMQRRIFIGGMEVIKFRADGTVGYGNENVQRYKPHKWYHFVIAADGYSSDKYLVTYLNGVCLGRKDITGLTGSVRIAQDFSLGSATPEEPAVMWIDNVKIYRQATRFAYTGSAELTVAADADIELPFDDYTDNGSLASVTLYDETDQKNIPVNVFAKELGYKNYDTKIAVVRPVGLLEEGHNYTIDISGIKSANRGQFGALNTSYSVSSVSVSATAAEKTGLFIDNPSVMATNVSYNAKYNIINNTENAVTPSVFMAIYINGILKSVAFSNDVTVNAGERGTAVAEGLYDSDTNVSEGTEEQYTYKTFIWDGEMKPLTDVGSGAYID